MHAILRTAVLAGALALVGAAGCDPGSIPNRNVNDATHEMRALNDQVQQLVVSNPNAVRIGTEFRVRIFREGQRPPIAESVEHVYVPASMDGTLDIDMTQWCDPDTEPAGEPAAGSGSGAAELPPPACSELRAQAVLLQTYWLADE